MLKIQEIKQLQDKSEEVLNRLESQVYDLKELSNDIEELLNVNELIACSTITQLVKFGLIPGRKFTIKYENGSTIGPFVVSEYNAQTLTCINNENNTVNASYKAILKMIETNMITFVDGEQ